MSTKSREISGLLSGIAFGTLGYLLARALADKLSNPIIVGVSLDLPAALTPNTPYDVPVKLESNLGTGLDVTLTLITDGLIDINTSTVVVENNKPGGTFRITTRDTVPATVSFAATGAAIYTDFASGNKDVVHVTSLVKKIDTP